MEKKVKHSESEGQLVHFPLKAVWVGEIRNNGLFC